MFLKVLQMQTCSYFNSLKPAEGSNFMTPFTGATYDRHNFWTQVRISEFVDG